MPIMSSWLRSATVMLVIGGGLAVAPGIAAQSDDDWWDDVLSDIATESGSTGEAVWQDDSFIDVNCADFGSWNEAQDFFEQNGGQSDDVFGLDADGDGVACESLG